MGGCAVVLNESPFNDVTTAGSVHVEEDQENDEERNHTQEKASFHGRAGAPSLSFIRRPCQHQLERATDESGNTSIPEGSVLKAGERIKLAVVLSNEGPTGISSGEYTDFIVSVPPGPIRCEYRGIRCGHGRRVRQHYY